MTFDRILPAITGLLGVLIGSLTLVFAGWTESERQVAIKRANALVEFSESMSRAPNDETLFNQKLNGLTVFADEAILKAYASLHDKCGEDSLETYQCRLQRAALVNAMRKSGGQKPVDPDVIIQTIWGEVSGK